MLNMTTQDKNKPAEYIDQTYETLKYNPQATQQIMSEGANAGLAGIGAMAANRFQQKANMTQQSQQAQQAAQNPQPTVLQQLQMAAMQGGIMGQLPGAIQAQQAPPGGMGLGDLPVDPNTLPQTMAGGGLVALAQGGDVRGFATGTSELLRAMDIPDASSYYNLGELLTDEDSKILQELYKEDEERYRDRMIRKAMAGEGVPESSLQRRGSMYQPDLPEAPEPRAAYKDIYGGEPTARETYGSRPSYTEKYGAGPSQAPEYTPRQASAPAPAKSSMIEGMSKAAHAPTDPIAEAMAKSGKAPFKAPLTGKGQLANFGKAAKALGKVAGPLGWASEVYGMYDTLTDPEFQEQYAQDWKENMPTWLGGDRGGRNGEVPTAQTDIKNPRAEVNKDGTKTDKEFERARVDSNHLAEGAVRRISDNPMLGVSPEEAQRNIEEARRDRALDEGQATPQGGLPAIQGQRAEEPAGPTAEEMRDQILALRGGAPAGMSAEERAWRKEQAESANTDKWLQTLTAIGGGVLAGGGRTWPEAIGQGALFGLNAYRRGAEEEGKAELGMLQAQSAYAEAQRKAQQDAADKLLGTQAEKMKLGSASDIARAKAKADWAKTEFTEAGKDRRAQLNAIAAGAKDQVTRDKAIADMIKMDIEEATKLNPAISPEEVAAIRAKYYQYYGATPPGQGLSGGMGLGNVPTFTRAGGLQSARP